MLRVRKMFIFLPPLFLLIYMLPIVFINPALPRAFTHALSSSEQSWLGGAYGATSLVLPASSKGGPGPSTPPGKNYGSSGPGNSCLGTLGKISDMISMDFGWPLHVLAKKWQNDTTDRLCNDHYIWESVTVLPVQKVLATLQWPSDLLIPQYATQMVALQPLRSFDPVTQQAQQAQQQADQQNQSSGPCDWVPDLVLAHPHIDVCMPIRVLVGAGSAAIRAIYQSATAQIHFLWQTPLQPFQDDQSSGLPTIWSTSWLIVMSCITVVIAYGSLRYMLGSAVNWLTYANIAELMPRLLFGLLAAYFSKGFFIVLIQANNALAGIFNHHTLDTVINGKASGIIDGSLQIVYGLMGFLLIIEEAARIAILYLLFAFAPILFFFAALRETQRWAKIAAVAVFVFVFIQAAQAATLDVGGHVLEAVLRNTDGQLGFLNLLVSLAILYLTLLLFFSLARMALGGGIYPFAEGAFALSRQAIPITAGYVGGSAATYRRARSNLFRLPGPDGKTPGSSGRGNTGGFGGPAGSGTNQTSVTIRGKPFVSSRNKPGSSGAGDTQTVSPAATRPLLTTRGKASGVSTSGVSRPSHVQGVSSTPENADRYRLISDSATAHDRRRIH